MKEILIVDVDYWNNKHLCDSCPIWNDEKYFCQYDRNTGNKGCPLKPMPQEQDIYEIGMDEEDTNAKRQWNKGWDACLKKITGETE